MSQRRVRGYEAMDPALQREIARKNRNAAYERKTRDEFDEECNEDWEHDRPSRRDLTAWNRKERR